MPVTIVCVGKLRERFFADAANEYLKRLRRLMPITVIDVQNELGLRREGERILSRLTDRDHVIALCVDAKQYESPELAVRLDGLFTQGKSHIAFVIGGSLGLHPSVLKRADERMSMSRMTFPHQLARVMLLEQLFRAAKINAGERYHK